MGHGPSLRPLLFFALKGEEAGAERRELFPAVTVKNSHKGARLREGDDREFLAPLE